MKQAVILLSILWLFAEGEGVQGRFLFQVSLRHAEDRTPLAKADIIPYALMTNSIIVEATEEVVARTGLDSRVIGRVPAGRNFYVVYPPFDRKPHEVQSTVAQFSKILAVDDGSFFVEAKSEVIEALPAMKFHLRWVSMQPIDLGFSKSFELPPTTTYNPVIQWIINQITVGEVSGMLRDLTGERPTMIRGRLDTILSRYTTNVKNSSAIWHFYEKALSYTGIDSVKFHPFTWSSYTDSNVVATKIGRVYPRQQYILCAHIDCVPSSGPAPGADDNGTSTIAALIGAKVTARIPFKRTIKFITFNAEEQGIYGSGRYASEAGTRGDSIRGVLNGEMLGYNIRARDSANAAHGNRAGSRILTQRFYEMDTTYHLGLNIRQQSSTPGGSDHQSFWNNGYEAACFWEWVLTPYYHTANDRITTLDTVFMTKMIKCLVATLCDLAEPDTVFVKIADRTGNTASPVSRLRVNLRSNPSHGRAAIGYYLSREQNVLIEIYELSGRCLLRLNKGVKGAGQHTATWDGHLSDGATVPSGVYFLKISAGQESVIKRLVFIR